MEAAGLLPHSKKSIICPYPGPAQSSPCPSISLLEDQF